MARILSAILRTRLCLLSSTVTQKKLKKQYSEYFFTLKPANMSCWRTHIIHGDGSSQVGQKQQPSVAPLPSLIPPSSLASTLLPTPPSLASTSLPTPTISNQPAQPNPPTAVIKASAPPVHITLETRKNNRK